MFLQIKHALASLENRSTFGEDFRLPVIEGAGAAGSKGGVHVMISSGGHSTVRDFPPAAFKFAVIRHPVDRFLSAYDFVREGGANHPLKGKVPQARTWQPFLAKFDTLAEFLKDRQAVRTITDPRSGHTHFWPLRHWICTSSEDESCEGVDFFIRQVLRLLDVRSVN